MIIVFFFNPFSSSSSKWVSFEGSRIIDHGIGGREKLNLQIVLPHFLQVFACLSVCRFTSSLISSDCNTVSVTPEILSSTSHHPS